MKTVISINKDKFLINGKLTYSEIENCKEKYHGLLMNSRMIQGVFDDKLNPERFSRYGKKFDAETNTDELIASMQEWYDTGLRAMTVGFQGGGPCFTIDNYSIDNNPYSEDGSVIDPKYLARMKRIIDAADEIGMVIIVSFLYGAQTRFLKDDNAIITAVKTASNWLRDEKFTNVIIEIANEQDVGAFKIHPIVYIDTGVATLIKIAQRESGGLLVGCSGVGGSNSQAIQDASDVIIIHGNDQSRNGMYNMIKFARNNKDVKPILFNEDSAELSQLSVTFKEGVSWGYYNNATKQEPAVYWNITKGEDEFFAARVAETLGIKENTRTLEEMFYLQGLEEHNCYDGKRWIRLASMYPEKIVSVDFYRNGELLGSSYEDPFNLNSVNSNWKLGEFTQEVKKGEEWKAVITLCDNSILEKTVVI